MTSIDFYALVQSCMCTSIRKLSRTITRIYDTYLEPSGLNINQLAILLTIQGKNDQRESLLTIKDMRAELIMEKSTLSRNLRVLEKSGYIITQILESNRKQKTVVLTKHGVDTVLKAYEYWDTVQQKVMSRLGDDQFYQLLSLLSKLETELLQEFSDII